MRCVGIIGGMSWESTAEYYRLLNRGVAARVGGLHSAPLLVHSVDFGPIAELQRSGDWDEAGRRLAAAAKGLEASGAEALVLATNTMHHVAAAIEAAVRVPLLHIVDPTGRSLVASGIRRAGLLGTRYTMELPFWRQRLGARFGVDVLVPEPDDRETVHRVIYEELVLGRVEQASRAAYAGIVDRLTAAGAEGIILGCTEIGMLIRPRDLALPVFDTTTLHVASALDFLCGVPGD